MTDDIENEIAELEEAILREMDDDHLIRYVAVDVRETNRVIQAARARGIEVNLTIGDDGYVRVGFNE